jgi:ABC-type Fe3+ transport system substrate-binding protein
MRTMKAPWLLLLLLATVLVGPIVLRPKEEHATRGGERTVIIVSPHNESIRSEFSRAFEAHWLAKTGQRVHLDWRVPGGTAETARYINSEYVAAFEYYWTHTVGRPWSKEVELAFDNAKVVPAADPAQDTPAQQARRAFLESTVSAQMDLFFGGGAFDFQQQANAGRLVDCGYVSAHPELFGDGPGKIPQNLSGEPLWDPQGRWVGNAMSSFGICYNTDALAGLRITPPPTQWANLADARYFHEIALANPTQSGAVTRTFEMLIQQQIGKHQAVDVLLFGPGKTPLNIEETHVTEGWKGAMRLLMKIGANSRYITDSSAKIAMDVEAGEAAAGMTIDFYGRFQSEAVRKADGTSRLQYVNARGGTSVGADPIGLFRGAPNPDVAKDFITFVMSPEGQKLWNWKVGTPGGPEHYALRRLPVLPTLYAPEFKALRSDPDIDPYVMARDFTYHAAWTAPLFRSIGFTFRVMCIDPHDELTAAWKALIDAGFPPEAMAVFENVDAVDYSMASGRMKAALSGDKIKEVQLAKELADHFRAQYLRAAELARAKR